MLVPHFRIFLFLAPTGTPLSTGVPLSSPFLQNGSTLWSHFFIMAPHCDSPFYIGKSLSSEKVLHFLTLLFDFGSTFWSTFCEIGSTFVLPHAQVVQCIQPHLHLPVKHHSHIFHLVLDSQRIHLPLGVGSGPKTLLPFPTIKTYDVIGIIVNHIHRIILLVVKSSYHSHDQPPAFRKRISVAISTRLFSNSPVASALSRSATSFCLFGYKCP